MDLPGIERWLSWGVLVGRGRGDLLAANRDDLPVSGGDDLRSGTRIVRRRLVFVQNAPLLVAIWTRWGDADNFDLGKWFRFDVELILEPGKTTRSTPFCTFSVMLLRQSSLSAQRVKARARCAGSLTGCLIEGLRDRDSVLKYATSN